MRELARWNGDRDCWETAEVDLLSGLPVVFTETWPASAMTRNNVLYELPTSGHHTDGSGFSFSQLGGKLPDGALVFDTPDTMPDAPNSGSNRKAQPAGLGNQVKLLLPTPTVSKRPNRSASAGAKERPSIHQIDKLLPSPRASDGAHGGPNQRGSKGDLTVSSAVALLPTPNSYEGCRGGSQHPDKKRAGGHQVNLSDVAEKELPALLPTPRAADHSHSMDAPAAMAHVEAGMGALAEVLGYHLLPIPKAGDADFGMPRTSGRPPEKSTHLMTRLVYTLPIGPDMCAACGHDDLVHDADGFCANCSPNDCRDLPGGQELLPTATAADANGSGGSSASNVTLTDAVVRTAFGTRENIRLLPSPTTSEANGIGCHGTGGADLRTTVSLLPTPKAGDADFGMPRTSGRPPEKSTHLMTRMEFTKPAETWGPYAAAIHRWEQVLGRPAPEPTEVGPKGGRRLSAVFVAWMMGVPDGWVTAPELGLSRVQQLRMLGNGVVKNQAVAALRSMRAARSINEGEKQ